MLWLADKTICCVVACVCVSNFVVIRSIQRKISPAGCRRRCDDGRGCNDDDISSHCVSAVDCINLMTRINAVVMSYARATERCAIKEFK